MIYESTTIKTRIVALNDECGAAVTTKTVVRVNGLHVQVSRSRRSKLVPPIEDAIGDEHDNIYQFSKKETSA